MARKTTLFHVSYAPEVMQLRHRLLADSGYEVISVLGNDQAMAVADATPFDAAVVGFSGPHSACHQIVRWLKLRYPHRPVIVLLAHGAEHFPDADCETLSEDPGQWLAAVRRMKQAAGG